MGIKDYADLGGPAPSPLLTGGEPFTASDLDPILERIKKALAQAGGGGRPIFA